MPDLPVEEAEVLARLAAERDFKLILLVTPTTPRERAVRIARTSTGFLYYVSVTGITGARDQLPGDLLEQLAWLRRQTDLPICVGFGISKPEHVKMLREVADGVIVGSALVRHLEKADSQSAEKIARAVGTLTKLLVEALNPEQSLSYAATTWISKNAVRSSASSAYPSPVKSLTRRSGVKRPSRNYPQAGSVRLLPFFDRGSNFRKPPV